MMTYGMGPKLLSENMKCSLEEANKIIEDFHKGFPQVSEWMKSVEEKASQTGYVEDFWGRRRRLPDLLLPEYSFSFKANNSFNPLLGSSGKYENTALVDKYQTKLNNMKMFNEYEKIKSDAEKEGLLITKNGGFISRAKRQCVNARIQGCISGDTKIHTKEYGIVNISKMVNKNIHVWDGEDWSSGIVLPSGKKQKCIITFNDKQKLVCSPDHKLLTVSTRGKKTFVACKDLKLNTRVVINQNYKASDFEYISDRSNENPRKAHNSNRVYVDDIKGRFERGVVLGRLASDGSYSVRENGGSGICHYIAEHEYNITEFLKSCMEPLHYQYHTHPVRPNRNQRVDTLGATSFTLAREIVDLDIKHHIDERIFMDTEMLRGFICGFFDGDGGISGESNIVLTFGKQYDFSEIISQMQKALLFFGIRSHAVEYSESYRLGINMFDAKKYAERIGFINSHKQEKAEKITTVRDEHVFGPQVMIKDIEFTDEYIDMYDVCDTERGYFVADGIITHNSAASMTKIAMIAIENDPVMKEIDFKLLIGVHDELIGECPEEFAEIGSERLTYLMRTCVPELDVPLKCDPTVERHWYEEEYQKIIKNEQENGKSFDEICADHTESTREQIAEYLK